MNAQEDEAAARVIRPWDERTQTLAGDPLRSDDDDPELIVHVPFVSDVKVRGLMIIGGGGGRAPSEVKVWVNKPAGDISFDNAQPARADAELRLGGGSAGRAGVPDGLHEVPGGVELDAVLPVEPQSGRHHRDLVSGFRGRGTGEQKGHDRHGGRYEARPMAEDHRTPAVTLPGDVPALMYKP